MLESTLQHDILKKLRQLGHWCCKMPAGLIKTEDHRMIRMGDSGAPDIIVSLRDTNVTGWIEVKQPSGSLSAGQKLTTLDHIQKNRRVLIADDLDDVLLWLKDPSYHGKEKWIKKLHEVRHYTPKPFKGTIGFKGTIYEELAKQRDLRAAMRQQEIGDAPF